ncbi:MAG: hypothetical protein ACOYB2_10840 [Limnohabitans sp.]
MGLREPLTTLLDLMEEFGTKEPNPFLNDPRVRACYAELARILDSHPPVAAAQPDLVPVKTHEDPETGLLWSVKTTDDVGNAGRCRSCNALILWVKRVPAKGGQPKPHPLDRDGTSHFATCPQAESWRSR